MTEAPLLNPRTVANPEPLASPDPPQPLLSSDIEGRLSPRQREILDALESLAVEEGFAERTMAQLARHANCSLRTLYGLAPRKDDLLLVVIDRRLHRIGREARAAMDRESDPLQALRGYLEVATLAVDSTRAAFARELEALPGGERLARAHGQYVVKVTAALLERAVEAGRIDPVDTDALAMVLGGLGSFFSHPEIAPYLSASPKRAADSIMEIILRGLARPLAPE